MSDVMRASSKRLFTVVSTFAGAGGSSTGYRLAGGHVVFANEFVDAAVETYRLNYPDTPVVAKDIRGLNRGKAAVERLFAEFGVAKGELDILDGSPPCATFSAATAGRGKEKMAKKDVAYSDTRQSRIGYLIHDYVFMANVMQPRVCVMENVPGIAKSEVFHDALERLRRYGYLVAYEKLTASDYGVPQKRQRLFVIAVRPDIARRVGLRSEADLAAIFPRPSSGVITIRQALAGLAIDKSERDMLLTMTRQSASYELLKLLPLDPPKHTRMSGCGRRLDVGLQPGPRRLGSPLPHHHGDGSAGAGWDLPPGRESRLHDRRTEAAIGPPRRLSVERHVRPEGRAYRPHGPTADDEGDRRIHL